MLSLSCGGATLELLPEIGGSVARFRVDGVDLLRPTPPGVTDALQTACFPLVPFANRVAQSRFKFGGETIRLRRNLGDHPHALHGQGWRNPWHIEGAGSDMARLSYNHRADDWPWSYRAEQSFRLRSDSVEIALRLENRDDRMMPAGLGFHPYFPRTAGTTVRTEVQGVWLSDDTAIPTHPSGPAHFLDLAAGADLGQAPSIDHCHFGWSGRAMMSWRDRPIRLSMTASEQFSFLHVYLPREGDYFCAEPMSAMPDALNRKGGTSGYRELAPGESLTASFVLQCIDGW